MFSRRKEKTLALTGSRKFSPLLKREKTCSLLAVKYNCNNLWKLRIVNKKSPQSQNGRDSGLSQLDFHEFKIFSIVFLFFDKFNMVVLNYTL